MIKLQIKANREEALIKIATKKRNKELFNYLMAAKRQREMPAKYIIDKL